MSRLTSGLTLSATAGAALYLAFAAFSGWREVPACLSGFAWTAGAGALLLATTNYGLRFLKWQYCLRRLGIAVPRRRSLAIFLSGFSLTVTPGKVGEVLKSYLLRESDGVPMARSAPIVLAERLTDLVGCLVLVVVGIAAGHRSREVLLLAAFAAALLAALVAAVASPRVAEWVLWLCSRLPGIRRAAAKLREFHRATRVLLGATPLAVTSALSVVAWASECAAFWLVLRGFSGTAVPLGLATFIYAATTVAGALSFLPGGLGVQEGGMIGLLVTAGAAGAGLDRPTAFAATLITRLCTLWYAVLVGVVALVLLRRTLRLDFGGLPEAAVASAPGAASGEP